jgi:hypothetical protein
LLYDNNKLTRITNYMVLTKVVEEDGGWVELSVEKWVMSVISS